MSFLTSLRPTPSTLSSLPTTLTRLLPHTSRRGLAKMTIIGRLADTPEKHATASGSSLLRYALATNHGPRDNRQTSWWRVAAFAGNEKLEDLMMGLGKG